MSTLFTTLPSWQVLAFAGDDAQAFLQGQVSSDVRLVRATQSQYSSYSSPKGRMLANFLVWQGAEGYRLMLSADIAAAIDKRLGMFILRSKVTHRVCDELALLGLVGEQAATLLSARFGACPEGVHVVWNAGEVSMLCLGPARYLLALPQDAAGALMAEWRTAGVAEVDETHWRALDISAGIPWITQPTQEAFVAQMANMDLIGAVSFTKGCYPGQEIVARTHYLGKLKRRLYRVQCSRDDLAVGESLFSPEMGAQAIGSIVNVVGSEALAVVQTSCWAQGVHVGAVEGARLSELPLPYSVVPVEP